MASEFGINYEKIGFRCGLEIHQQIGYHKLFCRCPTINIEDPSDYQIKRRLRGVVGETGELDIAAKFETEKGKYFLYEGHSANTCLVELDETPPYSMDKEALEIVLKVALLLNAKIIDEIQVMRKTVVDGSNVSGFQRTALVAMDGFINTSLGKVSIPTICLEEEAAQKIEEGKDFVRYRLDRLGIPLIVQDLRSIPKVIDYEVKRQLDAINQGKKLEREVRKAEPDFTTSFLRPLPGAARLYPETDVLPVKVDKKYLKELKKSLPKLLMEKVEEFKKKYNLPKQIAKEVIEYYNFEQLVKKFNKIEPLTIAHTLVNIPKEIKTRFSLDSSKLKNEDFEEVLSYLNEGKVAKEAIIDLLVKKVRGVNIDLKHFEAISEKDLEKEIKKIIEEKPGLSVSAYMGLVMVKYRGKVDGKKVMEIVKKFLS
ncbi:hypothetical protein HYW99_00205 [Candidatus Woesearchaeota archaeon]|nr:hypothetical protein [Candidatus Woesearchaeota archaeon]